MTHAARIAATASAVLLSGCVIAPVGVVRSPSPQAPVAVNGVPSGMQYLYGSGEAVAASRQAYRALDRFVADRVADARGRGATSVVLAPDATLARPTTVACAGRPPAIVLDVDETVLLNTGYEYSDAAGGLSYDAARWERWERSDGSATRPVPGAVEALRAIRQRGVTVVFNSNRSAATARYTETVLERSGLGPARHGDTLFLKGDGPGGSAKDARRAAIAARYCVIAMAGDQLGDFTDLLNAGQTPAERRAAADRLPFWGNGWFVLPNPVYGTALAGGFDEVFPNDLRWTDPGAAPEPAR